MLQKEINAQFHDCGGRGVIPNNLAQWYLLYLSTALAIWRIIRLSQTRSTSLSRPPQKESKISCFFFSNQPEGPRLIGFPLRGIRAA